MDYIITTIRLTKEQRETLEAFALFNKTDIASTIRALVEIFNADKTLQNRTLEAIKRNVVYDSPIRQPLSKPTL
jgi:hypothetical protein